MDKDINLIDYFVKNKEKYLKSEIKDIIEKIQIDILVDYPEIIKPESKTLILVESLEDALKNLNFNWLRDLAMRNELVWFHNNEPIDNLNLFFDLNRKYFLSSKQSKFEVVKIIIESWQYFIGEVLSNTGQFQNKFLNTNRKLLFLKTIDSKEWLSMPELFIIKRFGDTASGVYINFIYKEGDQDFETKSLKENILKFKKQQLSR